MIATDEQAAIAKDQSDENSDLAYVFQSCFPSYFPFIRSARASAAAVIRDADVIIDLNTASEADLASLPGITPDMARAAIKIRDAQQGFSNVQEFSALLGLSSTICNRILPFVCVNLKSSTP